MIRVILIAGPPRVGKDTAAGMMEELLPHTLRMSLSYFLKRFTHRAYGLEVSHNHFERAKDSPLPEFLGTTPRLAYVEMYRALAALYGPSVLGRQLDLRWATLPEGCTSIVPDLGRVEDALPAIERFGPERVVCLDLRRHSKGFDGDSREPVDLSPLGVLQIRGYNSGSQDQLREVVRGFLKCATALPRPSLPPGFSLGAPPQESGPRTGGGASLGSSGASSSV